MATVVALIAFTSQDTVDEYPIDMEEESSNRLPTRTRNLSVNGEDTEELPDSLSLGCQVLFQLDLEV